MSNRIEKVNSLLGREINSIFLKDFNFPEGVLVTLSRVDCTANLIEAKVYISVFPDDREDEIMKFLNRAVYAIQQKINKKLKMRPIPKIIFVIDKNFSKAGRVEELLSQLKNQEK